MFILVWDKAIYFNLIEISISEQQKNICSYSKFNWSTLYAQRDISPCDPLMHLPELKILHNHHCIQEFNQWNTLGFPFVSIILSDSGI